MANLTHDGQPLSKTIIVNRKKFPDCKGHWMESEMLAMGTVQHGQWTILMMVSSETPLFPCHFLKYSSAATGEM